VIADVTNSHFTLFLYLKRLLNSSRTCHFTLFLAFKERFEQQQNLPFHPIPCFLQLIITDLDDCCLNCHFTLFFAFLIIPVGSTTCHFTRFPGFFLKKITEQQHKLPFHPIPAFFLKVIADVTNSHFTLFPVFKKKD